MYTAAVVGRDSDCPPAPRALCFAPSTTSLTKHAMTSPAPEPQRSHVAAAGAMPIAPALGQMTAKAPRQSVLVDRRVPLITIETLYDAKAHFAR